MFIIKNKSTFIGLLVITFAFLMVTIFIQLFILTDSTKTISMETNNYLINNNHNNDYLIQDLNKMKYSFLNELKQLENKRRDKLKQITLLNMEINQLKSSIDKLTEKHLSLNFQLVKDQLQMNDLDINMKKKLNLIHLSRSNNNQIFQDDSIGGQYLFNYDQCEFNNNNNLFIWNNNIPNLNLKEISQSSSLVTNSSNACLIAIFLNNETNLNESKQFLNKNLILIDLNDYFHTRHKEYLNSSSIILASFNLNKFHNSDFTIDFSILQPNNINYFNQLNSIYIDYKQERKHLLSYHRSKPIKILDIILKQTIYEIELNCKSEDEYNYQCYELETRLNHLVQSKFTLLLKTNSKQQWSNENTLRLIEALNTGCIPVLIESDLKLPLDNLIAWNEIIIRIPLAKINYLSSILVNINENELQLRQIKARNVYQAYFSSQTTMFKTLIASVQFKFNLQLMSMPNIQRTELQMKINDEILVRNTTTNDEFLGEINQKPISSRKYFNNYTLNQYLIWNKYYYPFNLFPSTPFDEQTTRFNSHKLNINEFTHLIGGFDGKLFHYTLDGNLNEEQFTIVILTYKREQNLINLLGTYVNLPYLNSILIIWNEINTEPSKELKIKFKSQIDTKRMRIIISKTNSLNNRFIPYDLIETDAILSLDDDLMLRPDEILFAFRVWRTNRDQIVGFPARYHAWNTNEMKYVYKSQLSCEYSMILTGAAFYHRFYNYYYTFVLNKKIVEKINELNNCEDIAFNMMVSHLTRKPPIKVTTKFSFTCPTCKNDSISMKLNYYNERSMCIDYFVSVFNYNPLVYTQFRADSVLYKTKVTDDKQKCFKLI
jgi:hypothetical protein